MMTVAAQTINNYGPSDLSTTSQVPVEPFSGVSITDPNSGATETLTITDEYGGEGFGYYVYGQPDGTLEDAPGFTGLQGNGSGTYTLTGIAWSVTAELRALVFTQSNGTKGGFTTTGFTPTNCSSAGGISTTDTTALIICELGALGFRSYCQGAQL